MSALASRVAAARLSEVQEAALALREDGLGAYDIALELGIERAEVAQVLATARLALRYAVRDAPLPPASGAQCEALLPLLSARQDGERLAAEDRALLREHVPGCEHCRATRVALREGTLALRAALEAGPIAFGAAATVAESAPVVESAPVAEPAPVVEPEPVAEPVPVAEPAVVPVVERPAPARPLPGARSAPARRRRAPALAAVAALAACVATFATIFVGGDDPQRSSAAEPAATATPVPSATPDRAVQERAAAARRREAAARRRRAAARRRRAAAARRRAAAAATPSATAAPQATAAPEATATPEQRRRRSQRRQADDEAETQSGKRGAGLPQTSPTPNPDGTAGGPIRDGCTEENPDCESG